MENTVEMNVGQPSPSPVAPAVSLSAAVKAAADKAVPKGISTVKMDDDTLPDYLHLMLYGETNSRRTTTAALFGGPKRTLIISTRAPEQVRIPLRGLGFQNPIFAQDSQSLLWAIQSPEKAAEVAKFPAWNDLEDRVLVIDDMTEGAALLVDDNSYRDDGKEVKDGRQIYGATKADVRDAINALQAKKMHVIFTALAAEDDNNIFPEMSSGSRRIIMAGIEYVFFMRASSGEMLTKPEKVGYMKKDQFGKDVPSSRMIFTKCKIPFKYQAKTPPLVSAKEPMDLPALWKKIRAAK